MNNKQLEKVEKLINDLMPPKLEPQDDKDELCSQYTKLMNSSVYSVEDAKTWAKKARKLDAFKAFGQRVRLDGLPRNKEQKEKYKTILGF